MCRYLMAFLLLCSHLVAAQKPVLYTPEETAMLQKIAKEKSPDSLCYANADLATYYFNNGYFADAQQYYLASLRYAEQINKRISITSACNNIACSYNEMGKPDEAIPFSKRAIEKGAGMKNKVHMSSYYMTLGNSYQIKRQYPDAIKNYEISLDLLIHTKDSLEADVAYRNIGVAYLETGEKQRAVSYFKKSLHYRTLNEDTPKMFQTACGIAEVYNDMHRYDSAAMYLKYCDGLLSFVSDILYMLRDYHYARYDVFAHTGKLQEAIAELLAYQKFKDSIVNEDNQLAMSEEKNKYLLEKKDGEVTIQREIATREKNTRVLLSVVLVVSVLALVAFIFWLRGRQRTRLAEAELKRQEGERNMMIEGQENERKRIARELHDGLVQELTAIAINLQSSTVVDKQQIIDKVTQAAREARNIAHQMMPVSLMQLGLINALQDLFQQTYTPLGIGYEFEHFTNTDGLTDTVSVSLYRICQELVANSVKHAGATLVHVLLRQTPQQIMLVFEDNGKGFDVTLNRTGIGMVSITSRVRYLNGEISFDSDDGAGTTAIVKIPLHNPPTTA